jgi:outer membrane protein TolC
MIKKVFIISLVNIILLNYGLLYSQEILSLEPLLKEARENSPDILAAKKRWESFRFKVPQARSPDDPVIGAAFQYTPGSPFQLDKTPSMERSLSLQQFLPFFGKLSLKGKIALVESQMAGSEYKNTELLVISEVKKAYYTLFMNHKEAELRETGLLFLNALAQSAEARYTVGDIQQEDLFKINLEIAKLNNEISNLKQERGVIETRLNSLLNRKPGTYLGIPELPKEVSFINEDEALYRLTIENQPELLIFSYAIEKNKYAKSLAKRSLLPDIMTGIAMRGITTGTIGPWDLMLAFTVPLWFWTKQRYEIKEAIANLEEAQAAYKAMQNRAFSEVKDLATKVEIAKNKLKLHKSSLIPILESSIESSLAAFRSGKGDFMMLLDSQRMLIETKMNYYKALVDYNMNLADLERTVGKDLK